jgi:Pirin
MDDHLDIGDRPVGGPHPHAGFETVTLILDGAIFDRDEGGTLNAGTTPGRPNRILNTLGLMPRRYDAAPVTTVLY